MISIEARTAAARANDLKRPSPTPTVRTRTGAGFVPSPADSAEVDRRSLAMQAEMVPKTEIGRFFVHRLAELTVRVERCARQERAATELRVTHAVADFDEARLSEVDHLISYIANEPATFVRKLRSIPEGVDRMIAAFLDLRDELEYGDQTRWDWTYGMKLADLTSSRYMDVPATPVHALTQAIGGDFKELRSGDGEGLPDVDRRAWARDRLAELIDAEVEMLLGHRETLDIEAIERDRAGAADRAAFDPSKEATLARKYEAAAEREVHRTLRELRRVEAAVASEVPQEEVETSLGSSGIEAIEAAPSSRSTFPARPGSTFGRVERCNEGPQSVGPPHGFA